MKLCSTISWLRGPRLNGLIYSESGACNSLSHVTDTLSNFHRYLISPPYAVVYGKPSAQLADRLESDEKTRVEGQLTKLGQDGLAKLAKELEIAQAHNDRPIPLEYLTSFPLPNVGGISWIPVQSAQNKVQKMEDVDSTLVNNELAKHIAQDHSTLPFFVQYDHVKVHLLYLLQCFKRY